MKTILVTGGIGFIGSHTVIELIEHGYKPIIIDNLSNSKLFILQQIEKIVNCKIPFYEEDIRNTDALNTIFSDHEIYGVIHFAAKKAVGESVEKPLEYYENNVSGTINLLKVMKKQNCKNIIFSSSCTVYGQPKKTDIPVSENTPLQTPNCPYAQTKLMGENIFEDAAKAGIIKAISLRYFNPVGAHKSGLIGELPFGVPNNLMPFVTQTAKGIREKLQIFGNDYDTPDGTCIRDYIHVSDLAQAHVLSVKRLMKNQTKNDYEVFNVGTGKGISVRSIVEKFTKITNQELPHEYAARRKGDIEQIWADHTKMKHEMNWQPQFGINEMIRDSWQWQINLTNFIDE